MISGVFEYNGATVTLHRRTIRHKLLIRRILSRMTQGKELDDFEFYLYAEFVAFIVRANVEGDIGFTLPSVTASDAELNDAFEAFMSCPDELHDKLEDIESQVEQPLNDPDLTPLADPKG